MNFNQSLLMCRADELNERACRSLRRPAGLAGAPPGVERMDEWVQLTKHNRRMVMTMAFNYGGRAEMVDAVRSLVEDGTPAKR